MESGPVAQCVTHDQRVGSARKVRRFSAGVDDLGTHLVWCPEYRRPALTGAVAVRLEGLLHARAREKG